MAAQLTARNAVYPASAGVWTSRSCRPRREATPGCGRTGGRVACSPLPPSVVHDFNPAIPPPRVGIPGPNEKMRTKADRSAADVSRFRSLGGAKPRNVQTARRRFESWCPWRHVSRVGVLKKRCLAGRRSGNGVGHWLTWGWRAVRRFLVVLVAGYGFVSAKRALASGKWLYAATPHCVQQQRSHRW